jgi:hypothetical protein
MPAAVFVKGLVLDVIIMIGSGTALARLKYVGHFDLLSIQVSNQSLEKLSRIMNSS